MIEMVPVIFCARGSQGELFFLNRKMKYTFRCKGFGIKHLPTAGEITESEALIFLAYFCALQKTEFGAL
jgi:hypothetical protein